MVVLIGMALEGRGPRSQEVLSPLAQGSRGDAQLSAECFEALTCKQADDSMGLAAG
jgi:hypothetical protein